VSRRILALLHTASFWVRRGFVTYAIQATSLCPPYHYEAIFVVVIVTSAGGISQGGSLAMLAALTYTKPLAGIIGLSTWMSMHDKIPEVGKERKEERWHCLAAKRLLNVEELCR